VIQFVKKISGLNKAGSYLREELEKMKVLSSQTLVQQIRRLESPIKSFKEIEFSTFSQWGDDGIIQYLINKVPGIIPEFIEFGVSNYLESNTRFLLINDNWKGLVFDGSLENINFIKQDSISWKYDLTADFLFITKDNINEAIQNRGFNKEIGILHIDIDGNDYWIWDCLNSVNPQIVIMEYNSVFGNKAAISVPYKDDFFVTNAHYSNLFFGASLKAMNHLAKKKGYLFIGSNTAGNNAYFLRNDLVSKWTPIVDIEDGFIACNFRQNRNSEGNLTLERDDVMIKRCQNMNVVDVTTNEIVPLINFI
jgi:hypothetical protein